MNGNGKVSGVKMVRTEMGEPDAKGRRRAEIVAGSGTYRSGRCSDHGVWFPSTQHGMAGKTQRRAGFTRPHHRPGRQRQRLPDQQPKIFAGGDIVRGSDLVVTAIAEGRKAADGIMNWLEV